MKSIRLFLLLGFNVLVSSGYSQFLMPKIEDSDVAVLLNSPAIVVLNDGSQATGTVSSIFLMKGRLTDVTLKLQDESKRKFKPSEMSTLRIRLAQPTAFTVTNDSGRVIKKVVNSFYVFDHPFRTATKVKPEMTQLLNPAFDKKVKIFPDPNAGAQSITITGKPLDGSRASSYIVVKGEKAYYVKGKSYESDFKSIFSDCPKLMSTITHDQITFEALGSHALLYNHYCGLDN
jgi:hypothetical protein